MQHLRFLLRHRLAWVASFVACIGLCTSLSGASERFVDDQNGTVPDTQTGLMGVAQDNGVPINWPDAAAYRKNLRTAGYTDWRMPTVNELAGLYPPNESNKNGYHMTRLLRPTAQSCWSIETRGKLAGRFNFADGAVDWMRKYYSGPTRVLTVRTCR